MSGTCNPSVTSAVSGAIIVNALPSITNQSTATQTVCLNGSFNPLTITATGTGLTYQWYSNTVAANTGGTLINGATNSSYTPPASSAGITYYYCIVSGTCTPAATSAGSEAITLNGLPNISS